MAIEFAFLLLPFLLLMFAVLELALVFLISASLDTAMERAARSIRTGNFQTQWGGLAAAAQRAEFEDIICKQVTWLTAGCTNRLEIDVRQFGSDTWVNASSAAQLQPLTEQMVNGQMSRTFNAAATDFVTGGPTQIVLVRAWYKWPMITPFFSQAVVHLDSGETLITSTQTFRNEPYN